MFPRAETLLLSLVFLAPLILGLLALRDLVRSIFSMILAALGGV
jgi:hypothetical protein